MENKFFDESEKLKVIPKKSKTKLEVLRIVSESFSHGQIYSEKEVNEILKKVYDDYALLRRNLIEYKFLSRDAYGKEYERMLDRHEKI